MKRARNAVAILLLCCADTVVGDCSVSVSGMNFGTYYPTASSDSSGIIDVNCTSGESPFVSLDAGNNGTFFPRGMSNAPGDSLLEYNLYLDPARTIVWGDGSVASITVSNGIDPLTVYGRIPAGQAVAEGAYYDAIGVIVEW